MLLGVGLVGGTVTTAGVVMLVTPGPGLLVIIAGLAILATQFAWAERALERMKDRARQRPGQRVRPPGRPPGRQRRQRRQRGQRGADVDRRSHRG